MDVAAAVKQGQYLALDAEDVFSSFMIDGFPDPNRFLESAGNVIAEAAKNVTRDHAPVAACGHGVSLLCSRGNTEAAIRLEQLWNEAAAKFNLKIFCGYPLATFQGGVGSSVFARICAEHSAVHSH